MTHKQMTRQEALDKMHGRIAAAGFKQLEKLPLKRRIEFVQRYSAYLIDLADCAAFRRKIVESSK